jgi:hypothetical protein
MRSISDGKLLRRLKLPENGSLHDGEPTRHPPLPSWAKCTEPNHGTS